MNQRLCQLWACEVGFQEPPSSIWLLFIDNIFFTNLNVKFCSCLSYKKYFLPPLHTPFGSVAHPHPWPHGRAHVRDDFESCFLLSIATAASLLTSGFNWIDDCELDWCFRDLTSLDVAAGNKVTYSIFPLIQFSFKYLRRILTRGLLRTFMMFGLSTTSSIWGGGGSWRKEINYINFVCFEIICTYGLRYSLYPVARIKQEKLINFPFNFNIN